MTEAAGPYQAATSGGGGDWDKVADQVSDNLHVNGLPAHFDEVAVKALFGQYGTVQSVKVMPQKTPGTAAALIRFANIDEATAIKNSLNGTTLEGGVMPLKIQYNYTSAARNASADAIKGKDKGVGKGGGKSKNLSDIPMDLLLLAFNATGCFPGSDKSQWTSCLHVSGLPADCEAINLYKLFAPFGAIVFDGIKVMKGPDGSCKGEAFVTFVDERSVPLAAATLDNALFPDGTRMSVKLKGTEVPQMPGLPGMPALPGLAPPIPGLAASIPGLAPPIPGLAMQR